MKEVVSPPSGDWNGKIVVVLAGRGDTAARMSVLYASQPILAKTMMVGLQPEEEWYPSPRGPQHQKAAVMGVRKNVGALNQYLSDLAVQHKVTCSDIALSGFSAGAVMALYAAAVSPWPYAGVVCHSGCVLDPETLPDKRHDVPIYMYHAKDDNCFGWEERYVPSKDALAKKGYNLACKERETGGHSIPQSDNKDAAKTLHMMLGLA